MSVSTYVRTLQRHAVAIIVVAFLGALAGYLHGSSTPPTFRSSSRVLLTTDVSGNTAEIVQSSNYIQSIVDSYVMLANSELVLAPVIDELDLDATPKQLAGSVTASSPLNTVVIDISVAAGDPDDARDIAAAVTGQLAKVVSEVSPAAESGDPVIRLTTIGSATTPSFPIAPNVRRETMLGGLIGLALGLAYAFGRRLFGEPVRDTHDIAGLTSIPVLGSIIETSRATSFLGAVMSDRRGPQAESLQGLVTSLSFLQVEGGVSSLVVTSATPGESKTSVSSGLAVTLAAGDKRVLLIDCDLRNPSVGLITGLESAVGVSNVLSGKYSFADARQHWVDNVDVLTAGPVPPNPAQLLSGKSMRDLLAYAEDQYDFVVVDSAPLLAAADAVWLGHGTDGVLLLARRGKVTTTALRKALDVLETGKPPILGVALTRVRQRRGGRYGSYGSYGSYGKPEETAATV